MDTNLKPPFLRGGFLRLCHKEADRWFDAAGSAELARPRRQDRRLPGSAGATEWPTGAMPASIHHAADIAGTSHAGTLVDGAGPPGRIGAAIAVTEFRHSSRKRGCISRFMETQRRDKWLIGNANPHYYAARRASKYSFQMSSGRLLRSAPGRTSKDPKRCWSGIACRPHAVVPTKGPRQGRMGAGYPDPGGYCHAPAI
jgi:hypothetical protein